MTERLHMMDMTQEMRERNIAGTAHVNAVGQNRPTLRERAALTVSGHANGNNVGHKFSLEKKVSAHDVGSDVSGAKLSTAGAGLREIVVPGASAALVMVPAGERREERASEANEAAGNTKELARERWG